MKALVAGLFLALFACLAWPQQSGNAEAVFNELKSTDQLLQLKPSSDKPASSPDSGLISKSVELQKTLKSLYEADAQRADFFWGTWNLEQGVSHLRLPDGGKRHFQDAITALMRASGRGEPTAAWNLALMYANGWGVNSSKLVAAEWYARAGDGYRKIGDRERAMAAVERAQELEPASTAAMRLRKLLESDVK
jgi:TPR repeat protein